MTDGIVLREQQISEIDSLLTLLTKERGIISAYARGARKQGAHRASKELLSYSCFVLFFNRDRYSVDHADMNRLFMGIRADVEKLALASYFCELAMELVPKEETAEPYLRLFLNTLHLLDKGKKTCEELKPVFELRLMTMAGFMPDLIGCKNCRCFEADRMFFLPQQSILLCENCCAPNIQDKKVLSKGVLAAMRHILYSESDKIYNFSLSEQGYRVLNQMIEHYIMVQLEKRFPTWLFYESFRQ